jgi:hypothetical protein
MDNPEPGASRQARAAGQHVKQGSKQSVRLCSNPDCHHNAKLNVSRLPDDVTFGDLQPRVLCTVCNHRGAEVSPSWLHHG